MQFIIPFPVKGLDRFDAIPFHFGSPLRPAAYYVGYSQWVYSPSSDALPSMTARTIFAWNLRRLRVEKGISQERLAADAEVDRAYVSELERKRGNATLDMLDRLAAVLDVELLEFFRTPKGPKGSAPSLKVGRKPSAAAKRRRKP